MSRTEPTNLHNDMKGYVARGIYVTQLERYLEFFELQKNLLVIGYEEFFQNPNELLPKLTDFLELPRFDPPNIPHSGFRSNRLPAISDVQRRLLQDFYSPFNEKLFSLIGREFNWA